MSAPPQSYLRFLIDEDLSPALVQVAKERGFAAASVKHRPKLVGRSDHDIAKYALETDSILVTRNAVDFEAIYVEHPTHPGLIFLDGTDTKLCQRRHQCLMLKAAIDDIIENGEPLQTAIDIQIAAEGDKFCITIDRYWLPDLIE